MGRLAKLLSFVRVTRRGAKLSDVKFDPGGGPNITAEHFADAGDDAHPLPDDYIVTVDIPRDGGEAVVGYLDPLNEPKAQPGDKRIYGRKVSGEAVNQVWLMSDGSILVSNENGSILMRPDGGTIVTTPASTYDCKADGSITGQNNAGGVFSLQAGGVFLVNGVTIDLAGNITTPTKVAAAEVAAPSIKAADKELAGHDHPAGSPPGNTGPNN